MTMENQTMRRKKLRMLASQRGYLEVEILLRSLVKDGLDNWSEKELDSLENLLQIEDLDIWEMITGRRSPPMGVMPEMIDNLKKSVVKNKKKP